MTAGTTVASHHLLEGPEDAPALILSNSLGTTGWPEAITQVILDNLSPVVGREDDTG